jgi:hypothetical protein
MRRFTKRLQERADVAAGIAGATAAAAVFEEFEQNGANSGTGTIDIHDLRKGLDSDIDDAEVGYLMGVLDKNQDGKLTVDDFKNFANMWDLYEKKGVKPGLGASILLSGVASVIAVNFIHPIELVKTRIQLTGLGITATAGDLVKKEGYRGFAKGIQAAWYREGTYTAIKMGAYAPLRDLLAGPEKGASAPMWAMFSAGCITGAAGSAVSNPFDVLKTMQMANQTASPRLADLARTLKNEQGYRGFYRGLLTNVMRGTVNNGTKFASYDVSKRLVEESTGWARSDPKNYFLSSVISSFCMAVALAPFDMVRTQLMNQPVDRQIYSGFADCFGKIVKKDGPTAFYRGFVPLYARMLPATILQLGIFEVLLDVAGYETI